MPSYSAIAARVITHGAPGTTFDADIVAALTQIYEGSTLAAAAVDAWLNSHPGQYLEIYPVGGDAYATGNGGEVYIDPTWIAGNGYISDHGQAVADSLVSGLAHELSHAVTNNHDSDSFSNLNGANIDNVDKWYAQLGITKQVTYEAYDIGRLFISTGFDYTDGSEIKNAIIDFGHTYTNPDNGFTFDPGNIDLSANGVTGSSLVSGSNLNNNYGGTSNADWLYGHGGIDTIDGKGGNDFIYGGAGADALTGDAGDDRIWGGDKPNAASSGADGDDTINGGNGDDKIYGGAGADTLNGGANNDEIWGGDDPTATNGGTDGIDTIDGGAGDDKIYGGDGDDVIVGGAGNDKIWGGAKEVESGTADGMDTVDYHNSPSAITLTYKGDGTTPYLQVKDGLGGKDDLHSIEKVIGTSKADVLKIVGRIAQNETLVFDANHGQNGRQDILNGKGAVLDGASGFAIVIQADGSGTVTDTGANGGVIHLTHFDTDVVGTNGSDTITDLTTGAKHFSTGDGDDTVSITAATESSLLIGGAGNDTLTGGAGNDFIVGSAAADTVFGGSDASNHLDGGDGNDMMVGAGVGDEYLGGAGDDYITYANSTGMPTIDGGAGDDVINLRAGGLRYNGNYGYGTSASVIFGADSGHDTVLTASGGDVQTGTIDGHSVDFGAQGMVVRLDGLTADDIDIIWDVTPYMSNGHLVYGGAGDLAIVAKSTGASLFIEDVAGLVTFDTGGAVSLGLGIEDSSGDIVWRFPVQYGDLSAYRGGEAAFLDGAALSPAESTGTSGDDDLAGGLGDDQLTGGDGDDSFLGSAGNDTIDGGNGDDVLTLMGSRDDYDFTQSGGDVVVQGRGFDAGTIHLTSVEHVYFETDDATYGFEDLFGYYGTNGNDTLTGNELGTSFFALDGDDVIAPGNGGDTIDGGAGNDEVDLLGAAATSQISRELDGSISVYDTVSGDYDVLSNVETIVFVGDNTTIHVGDLPPLGTASDDTITGTARGESLYGQDGNDTITGLGGNDYLDGGSGDDVLDGGTGDNGLEGGDGADTLIGGGGADYMSGDGGSDTYIVGDSNGVFANTYVADLGDSNDQDLLVLGDASYTFSVQGDDLVITNDATSATVTVALQLAGFGVEHIQIGSTLLDRDDIVNLLPAVQIDGTSSDDSLNGTAMKDVITGYGGDDTMSESAGDDTYVWTIGDGSDAFVGGFSGDGFDTLQLGSGIDTSDVTAAFTGIGQQDITLTFAQGGSVLLQGINDGNDLGIDQVVFDDTTIWDRATLISLATANGGGGDPGGGGPLGRLAGSYAHGGAASQPAAVTLPTAQLDDGRLQLHGWHDGAAIERPLDLGGHGDPGWLDALLDAGHGLAHLPATGGAADGARGMEKLYVGLSGLDRADIGTADPAAQHDMLWLA